MIQFQIIPAVLQKTRGMSAKNAPLGAPKVAKTPGLVRQQLDQVTKEPPL